MKLKNTGLLLMVPLIIILMLILINNNTVNVVPLESNVENESVLNVTGNAEEFGDKKENGKDTKEEKTSQEAQVENLENNMNKQKSYTAMMKTSEGDITIKLNDNETPNTVENFVTLANKNFYDNTIFHRVMSGFMIQGGDPKGDGTGGPGYKFDDEPFTGEYVRGAVAMANSGPNTNGSQFFIMHADYPLPKNYTIFGMVTEGLDVVDKIATAETKANNFGEKSVPLNPVKVLDVVITEN